MKLARVVRNYVVAQAVWCVAAYLLFSVRLPVAFAFVLQLVLALLIRSASPWLPATSVEFRTATIRYLFFSAKSNLNH